MKQRTLKEFFENGCRNEWLISSHMSVYVRKSNRILRNESDKLCDCFDIANVNVEARYQNTGIFTKFLDKVEKYCPRSYIFVENMMIREDNQWWLDFFLKRGYKYASAYDIANTDKVICLYKKIRV